MNTATVPIATTTSLSVLLHAVVIAATLQGFNQTATTGRGLDILLVSSTMASDQQETEKPHNNSSVEKNSLQSAVNPMSDKAVANRPIVSSLQRLISSRKNYERVPDVAVKDGHVQYQNTVQDKLQKHQRADEDINTAQVERSTNPRTQQHSLLELLHSSISSNKEYPYLARRQRREGVATVGFVLQPDGTIKNAHLVSSSSTAMLDRAALSAVKRIAPFRPARDYIKQAEEFSIDVVFKLL